MVSKKKQIKQNESTGLSVVWLILILVVTFIIFSTGFNNQFTNWDDPGYITNNPLIKNLSFESIYKLFTRDGFYGANYHPFTALSNALEIKFFGMKPIVFHFFNLLFHLINIVWVYKLIRMLSKEDWVALAVALVFALHPTRVESVTWMAERKDVLFTFFLLPALIQYLKFNQTGKAKHLIFTVLLFIASLLSKSTAIILPLLLIWIDLYQSKFSLKRLAVYIPLLLVSAGFGMLALESQKSTIENFNTPIFSLFERPFIAAYALCFYLVYAFLPLKLSAIHPFPTPGELDILYYLALAVVLVLVFLCWRYRDRKYIWFGLGFFLIGNLLTLQLLPVGKAITAERYTYMPYIGLCFTIFYALFHDLKVSFVTQNKNYILIGLILIYAVSSYSRIGVWKSSETLWDDCIDKYPDYYYGYFARAQSTKNPVEHVKYYDKCLELNPKYPDGYCNRSEAYMNLQQYDKSLRDADSALKYQPNHFHTHNNRGVTLEKMKQYDEALKEYLYCLNQQPTNGLLMYNISNIYIEKQQYDSVIQICYRALQNLPDYNGAMYNLGYAYAKKIQPDSACSWFRQAELHGSSLATEAIKLLCTPNVNRMK